MRNKKSTCNKLASAFLLARPVGLEPTTYGLEGRCSIQLSYERKRCYLLMKLLISADASYTT